MQYILKLNFTSTRFNRWGTSKIRKTVPRRNRSILEQIFLEFTPPVSCCCYRVFSFYPSIVKYEKKISAVTINKTMNNFKINCYVSEVFSFPNYLYSPRLHDLSLYGKLYIPFKRLVDCLCMCSILSMQIFL